MKHSDLEQINAFNNQAFDITVRARESADRSLQIVKMAQKQCVQVEQLLARYRANQHTLTPTE